MDEDEKGMEQALAPIRLRAPYEPSANSTSNSRGPSGPSGPPGGKTNYRVLIAGAQPVREAKNSSTQRVPRNDRGRLPRLHNQVARGDEILPCAVATVTLTSCQ
ncbi:hypothetical protein O3P69_020555 [Scylla paramamosain]|uniref:Uncharacterized protein n=1 Tax=Scylla paramamosain TaxID=85552 RepID=A0AAW0TPP4_SCYPA